MSMINLILNLNLNLIIKFNYSLIDLMIRCVNNKGAMLRKNQTCLGKRLLPTRGCGKRTSLVGGLRGELEPMLI